MKKFSFFILLTVLLIQGFSLAAEESRTNWFEQMREHKHAFLANELELTSEQQNEFFPIYDEMEDSTMKLSFETRQLEERLAKRIMDGEPVTDLEYDTATQAIFDRSVNVGEIERSYLPKFQKILNKKQLFLLKGAERKFTKEAIRFHQEQNNAASTQE